MGQIAGKVAAYASMFHDQDQRDNAVTGRRQQVDILIARWIESSAWFRPELLAIPLETVRQCQSPPSVATKYPLSAARTEVTVVWVSTGAEITRA